MSRLLTILAAVGTIACTPTQIAAWHAWHDSDPKAAENFALRSDIQAELGVTAGTLPDLTPGTLPELDEDQGGDYVPEHGWAVWRRIGECESGGNPAAVSATGRYMGLYQFSLTSWRAVGGIGYPHHASVIEQTRRAELLEDIQGFGAWPVCGRFMR